MNSSHVVKLLKIIWIFTIFSLYSKKFFALIPSIEIYQNQTLESFHEGNSFILFS